MVHLIQPRLVNEPFSDPGLFLDFRFARRAILFDLGDLAPLSSREILRVSHVFVSHMHMDHFAGFDRLLRLNLYRTGTLHLVGPPGFGDAVEAKLRAYTWNLLGPHSADLALVAGEWSQAGFERCSLFRAREAFARREIEAPQPPPGVLLDEAEFSVEGAVLDHGIACLAFAFQERLRVNVHKARLDALRLPVGPWLTEAKRAVRRGDPPDTPIAVPDHRSVPLSALIEEQVLQTGRGQRIVYVTDMAHEAGNVGKAARLAAGADHLFIEAGFLQADKEIAAAKRHLTAAQAGRIARQAGALRASPHHFSARYAEREEALQNEFQAAFVEV